MSEYPEILAGAHDPKLGIHLAPGSRIVYQVDPAHYYDLLRRLSNYARTFDAVLEFEKFDGQSSRRKEPACFMVITVAKQGRDVSLRGRAFGSSNTNNRVFHGEIKGRVYAVAASSYRNAAASLGVSYHVARNYLNPTEDERVIEAALAAGGDPIEIE